MLEAQEMADISEIANFFPVPEDFGHQAGSSNQRAVLKYAESCRLCLKSQSCARISIDRFVEDKFFQLTQTMLSTSSLYSQLICQSCYTNLKESSHFKSVIMKNQKKLDNILAGAYEDNEGKELNYNSDSSFRDVKVKIESGNLDITENEIYLEDSIAIQPILKEEFLVEAEENVFENTQDDPSGAKSSEKVAKRRRKRKREPRSKPYERNEYRAIPKRTVSNSLICEECGKIFSNGKDCRAHYERVHLQIKNYSCDLCSYQVYTKGHLRVHMSGHIKNRIYQCHQCDKAFHRLDILKNHLACTHSDERAHVCQRPDCKKTFKTASALNSHIQYIHKDDKKHQCEICLYVAYSNYQLKDHQRIHKETPEVRCNQCGQLFFKMRQLREHVMKNHEEPKYTCEDCGKKFFLMQQLKTHFKTNHSMQRDFPCPYCDKSYFKNSNLNRHIMHFHMKLKFKCELPGCSSSFARKESYKNHVKESHKDLDATFVAELLDKIHNMKQELPDHTTYKLNFLKN